MRSTVGLLSSDEDRLAERLQRLHERIVVAQQHLVVELAVDPALDHPLDVAEVADHVAVVERAGAHLDFGHGVVAVRMLADAVVVEQAVAVAEVDTFRDGRHGGIVSIESAHERRRRSLLSGGLDSACCSPTRPLAVEVQPIYSQRRAGLGERRTRWCRASARTSALDGPRVPPRVAERRHARRLRCHALGGPRPAARVSHG